MSDHFPDGTKKVSDTPRTDESVYPMNGVDIVWPEFAQELERENHQLKEHIKQLEQSGNQLCEWCEMFYESFYHNLCLEQIRQLKKDIKLWRQVNQ